jgi:hypothetical protein
MRPDLFLCSIGCAGVGIALHAVVGSHRVALVGPEAEPGPSLAAGWFWSACAFDLLALAALVASGLWA